MYRPGKVKRFDFPPGKSVAGKYLIESPLGSGWEGEVYAIVERATGIRRAAKFYYPHRDPMGKAAISLCPQARRPSPLPDPDAISPPGDRLVQAAKGDGRHQRAGRGAEAQRFSRQPSPISA